MGREAIERPTTLLQVRCPGRTRKERVAEGSAVVPGFGSISEFVSGAVESTFESRGTFGGYDVWSVQDGDGAVHLLASDGTTLSQARSSSEDFLQIGVPIRIDTPTSSVQFALLPSDQLDASGLLSAGYSQVTPTLYATANTAEEYSVVEMPSSVARGGVPVMVPLFIAPTD